MPRYTFPTNEETKDAVVYPKDRLFTNAEYESITAKMKEVEKKYGFRLEMRQGFGAALRLHILATTDYTLDQVLDFTKMPKAELMGYVNSFFDMMDDTKEGRTKADCAKALATTHKAAFEKIMNYRIENFRTDNIEYMAKSMDISAGTSVLSAVATESS